MVKLYHYTNYETHCQIKRTKVIRVSTSATRDCRYGTGVYLTSMNPSEHEKEEIARNNYAGGWQGNMRLGKLDYHFEFDIPSNDFRLEKCNAGGRDIYLYKDNLPLDRYANSNGKNSEWSASDVLGAVALGVGVGAALAALIGAFASGTGNGRTSASGNSARRNDTDDDDDNDDDYYDYYNNYY